MVASAIATLDKATCTDDTVRCSTSFPFHTLVLKVKRMTLYYFDVHDSDLSVHDHAGTECRDRAAVSTEALRALCEIAADHTERYSGGKLRVAVRDAKDRTVLTASISLTAAWHVKERSEAA